MPEARHAADDQSSPAPVSGLDPLAAQDAFPFSPREGLIDMTTHTGTEPNTTCPNCGSETSKTGSATPGNTPERKCPACGWLNWYGRPAHTDPPYTDHADAARADT